MKILLTNDDGVLAPGLLALKKALCELGDVTVVAPLAEQSGVSHAITYLGPVRMGTVRLPDGSEAYGIEGTPADSVKFGLLEVFEEPPDLVVSGINVGLNTGVNVFYSGTVAAAVEAAISGVPAVALSTARANAQCLQRVAQQGLRVLRALLGRWKGMGLAYNVNLPELTDGEPDIVFVAQAVVPFPERYAQREGAPGESLYQLEMDRARVHTAALYTDVLAVREGKISVTPLRASLTDMEALKRLGGARGEPDLSASGL